MALLCSCVTAEEHIQTAEEHIQTVGVSIQQQGEEYVLLVDGAPTYIKGVGGASRLDLAVQSGANAFRTWGGSVKTIQSYVEQARTNKMFLMQGIDLTKDSAQYFNEAYKEKLRADVRLLAETFKDEPQILAWGIGNEINLGNANIGAAWSFVDELARLIKSIDSRHLVSSVISHHATALDSIAKYASTLDFVGINSYGGIGGVEALLAKSTYKGAYMVTEWGPNGYWEVQLTDWKAPLEQTSEEKRVVYEERYKKHILGSARCLGSFVFLWGQKEERTPTWFSLFVETAGEGLPLQGERTPMVEAMQRVWTGVEPAQTAPVLRSLTINAKQASESVRVRSGESFQAAVSATDRENETLTYIWETLREATVLGSGGSAEPRPARVGAVAVSQSPTYTASVAEAGNYRLYVYVLDKTGFVATANIPFQVQ
jgi:hypothetical protein